MHYMDMHCDTISVLYAQKAEGKPYSLLKNDLHIDLQKMRKGDCLLQNFALFVHQKYSPDTTAQFVRLYEMYEEMMEENSALIGKVLKFSDIAKNQEEGKFSALLTMEEAAPLKGEIHLLQAAYRLGVRMIALTWNYPNEIAWPNIMHWNANGSPDFYQANTTLGLTEKGIGFVQEMERLGIIADTSHLSDAGFYDLLRYTKKPFVASHSDARSVSRNVRNLTDDMIRKLAERGGVSGINFSAPFLHDGDEEGKIEYAVENVRHFVKTGGIGCVGLGSDFDGIRTNRELYDCTCMPKLADALVKAGFSEDEVEQIFWKNVMRVYREVLK